MHCSMIEMDDDSLDLHEFGVFSVDTIEYFKLLYVLKGFDGDMPEEKIVVKSYFDENELNIYKLDSLSIRIYDNMLLACDGSITESVIGVESNVFLTKYCCERESHYCIIYGIVNGCFVTIESYNYDVLNSSIRIVSTP